jgi:hypothetical protein
MTRRHIGSGRPEPLGVTADAAGVNVAVFSAHATRIDLCLFDDGDRETARMTLPERTGDVFHGHVAGLRHGVRYGLRAHGPHAPREGHRFNAHKLLLDPNAALIDRPFVLHPSMFGYRQGHPDADLSFDDADSAPFMPKAVIMAPAAPPTPAAPVPWNRSVIYEMHVRGFTMLHPKVPRAIRGTFAGLGHPAALKHLADLGISSVELLPVAGVARRAPPRPDLGLGELLGLQPGRPSARRTPGLAPGGWEEIRRHGGCAATPPASKPDARCRAEPHRGGRRAWAHACRCAAWTMPATTACDRARSAPLQRMMPAAATRLALERAACAAAGHGQP